MQMWMSSLRLGLTGGAGSGRSAAGRQPQTEKDPCAKLKAMGITASDFARMKNDYYRMVNHNSISSNVMREFGHARVGGDYYEFNPSGQLRRTMPGTAGRLIDIGLDHPVMPSGVGYTFHTHHFGGRIYSYNGNFIGTVDINNLSQGDRNNAFASPSANFMGNVNGLFAYGPSGSPMTIAGANWMKLDCK